MEGLHPDTNTIDSLELRVPPMFVAPADPLAWSGSPVDPLATHRRRPLTPAIDAWSAGTT